MLDQEDSSNKTSSVYWVTGDINERRKQRFSSRESGLTTKEMVSQI